MGRLIRITFLPILVTYLLFVGHINSIESMNAEISANHYSASSNYIPHDPITINSNDDFVSYGFDGNGTSISPYIIANYSITGYAEYGIKICCVTAKYSIQNCYIDIYYDTFTYAIYLQDSPDDCSVINNTCVDCYFGLYLNHCSNMLISENLLVGNVKGLYTFNSNLLTISYNNCTTSNQFAFDVYDCLWIYIIGNRIYNNLQTGIKFNDVHNSVIRNNSFIETASYAVYIKSNTYNNEVYFNSFIDNAREDESQAYDSSDTLWHEPDLLIGNMWSDLGFNCYYELDGASRNYDYYPINKEENCTIYTPPTSDTSPTSASYVYWTAVSGIISLSMAIVLRVKKKTRE